MLRSFGVTPVMVFDGSPLPSKLGTEESRRESREKHKAKGIALLRAGKRGEAIECFQKAVDVTPEMAKTLIDACKREGVEVIVAPCVRRRCACVYPCLICRNTSTSTDVGRCQTARVRTHAPRARSRYAQLQDMCSVVLCELAPAPLTHTLSLAQV